MSSELDFEVTYEIQSKYDLSRTVRDFCKRMVEAGKGIVYPLVEGRPNHLEGEPKLVIQDRTFDFLLGDGLIVNHHEVTVDGVTCLVYVATPRLLGLYGKVIA